nr:hypothetical protein [Tanacetum cinerariifolium]
MPESNRGIRSHSKDLWQCSICGLKSRRGSATTFEVLPRLNEIKFSSGVIDKRWCLEVEEPRSVLKFVTPKIIFQSGYKAKSMSQLRSDDSNVSNAVVTVLKLLKRVHSMFYDTVLNSAGNVQ